MGCKGGNNYTFLSTYITPTYILTNIKTKESIVNISMIKTKFKITGNFENVKITTYRFEEEADDRRNDGLCFLQI